MTDNEVKWMIVGKLLRRNLMAVKGEPVAYSYNGVVLPKLPSEILSQPNIFIGNVDAAAVAFGFSGTPETWVSSYVHFVGTKEAGNKVRAQLSSDGTGWEVVENVTDVTFSYPKSSVHWANYDILNTDGTVYLAGSEPVPVYE